jgi:hypothetical protein
LPGVAVVALARLITAVAEQVVEFFKDMPVLYRGLLTL